MAKNANLLLDTLALGDHPALPPQRPRGDLIELAGCDRLEQVIEGTVPQTINRSMRVQVTGHHDHCDIGRPGRQFMQKVNARFARPKMNVAQHQVHRSTAEGFARGGKRFGFGDQMTCGFERETQECARIPLILDDENSGGSDFG